MKCFSYLVVAAMIFGAVFTSCDPQEDPENDTKEFTVSFDADGGTPVPQTQTVKEGEKASKPSPDPAKEGFTFDGWFSGSAEWNFDAAVISDMTLKAKWTEKAYKVTFNSNDGSTVQEQTVTHGGKVTEPEEPNKDGFTFVAWFKEATLTNEWKFDSDVVTADITLYAKWIEDDNEKITNISGTVIGDFAGWTVGLSFDFGETFYKTMTLNEDEKFSFDLPEEPDEKYQHEINPEFDEIGISVSAPNVKLVPVSIFIFQQTEEEYYQVYLRDSKQDDKIYGYFWANKDADISGSWDNGSTPGMDLGVYDYKFKRGWNNTSSWTEVSEDVPHLHLHYEVSVSSIPEDAVWNVSGYDPE